MGRSELFERLREDISWLGACETERIIISHIEYAMKLLEEQEAKIEQLNRFVNGFSRDAMPVVRCKDCQYGRKTVSAYADMYCERLGRCVTAEWYCADGKEISNAVENVF